MTVNEWINSRPMRDSRLAMFGTTPNSFCSKCQTEETYGHDSRRCRSNQKSVIFTHAAFDQSYRQSPGYQRFEHARWHDGECFELPIDVHIDLGNFCNLACKMCSPQASSQIAAQHLRWGMQEAGKFLHTDWTRDDAVWQRFLTELAGIENLRNVHFMGGETLITKRFEHFVDFMLEQNRLDLCLSFVTNGTVFNQRLMDKLLKFSRVGIEVSIESLDATNSYQRQGTDQDMVMRNLEKYLSLCDQDQTTVALRPAVSALTIGSYPDLLSYAFDKQLVVKALLVTNPRYLDARILPKTIKSSYLRRYTELINSLDLTDIDLTVDSNTSDPHQYKRIIANQIHQCRALLEDAEPVDADLLRSQMIAWCRRWDDIYGYDARQIYPEFREMLDRHGY